MAVTYLTVIISDQPIAQREGWAGIIETLAVELPAEPAARAAEVATVLQDLSVAAQGRMETE